MGHLRLCTDFLILPVALWSMQSLTERSRRYLFGGVKAADAKGCYHATFMCRWSESPTSQPAGPCGAWLGLSVDSFNCYTSWNTMSCIHPFRSLSLYCSCTIILFLATFTHQEHLGTNLLFVRDFSTEICIHISWKCFPHCHLSYCY